MMTQDLDLQSIRQELKATEAFLLDRLQAASEEPDESESNQSASNLGDLYDTWKQKRTSDSQIAEQLEQVRAALRRLDEGTYGICTSCGAEINPERLSSLPYAELCITCQRKQEKPLV